MPKVLLIDDDVRLRALVEEYLTRNGVVVVTAPDGEAGLARFAAEAVDAVILDVMLPGIDGLEVLRRLRLRSNVPVVMLTAKGDETDRVVGLEVGADDYLPKPFGPRELLARLRAVLRRVSPNGPVAELRVGPLVLDLGTREVRDGDARIELTGLEFDLLHALARRAGRSSPRQAGATSLSAIAPSTSTSPTSARSSATIRRRPAASRRSAASATSSPRMRSSDGTQKRASASPPSAALSRRNSSR